VVPSEFSNWRDEQAAWAKSAVLFDQSHHMVEQYVQGPDTLKLFTHLGMNSFANFPVNRAKQLAPTNYDGYIIGDGILFHLEENHMVFVGRAPAASWIQFHAETGGFNVKTKKDDRSPGNTRGLAINRTNYRFQIQGPNAWKVIEKLNGGPVPEVKFFHMATMKLAGRTVRTLRHGMAGAPGLEIWGPYAEREEIRAAVVAAGKEFGLKEVGSRAYATNTCESGWIPSPLPAVYTGEKMKKYREWLPSVGFEGNASLGGSYVSNNIDDHYTTPYDLGYGAFVKFDHDFVGRAALEKFAAKPHRIKVTLELNDEDVINAIASQYGKENERAKYFDFPSAVYSMYPQDRVLSKDGKQVGVSTWVGYSSNERKELTLAYLEPEFAKPGTEVTFVWGEPDGGSKKPTVESHKQVQIRAIVCPVPYVASVRTGYAEGGWRATGKL
jgi:glycine cleavage system aminomethyltransferase T